MTYTHKLLSLVQTLPDVLIYLFLGLSAFIENLFPPIPGDTVTAFGAFLVGIGKLNFLGVYVATTLGSLVGFLTLFGLGGYLGRRFFMERDFRFLKAKDIAKAEHWFGRYGYLLILFNRFLPGIRSAISLAGGISGLKTLWVALLAFVSCSVWNLIWIAVGHTLGKNWTVVEAKMSDIMMHYNIAVFALFVVMILVVLIIRRSRKG